MRAFFESALKRLRRTVVEYAPTEEQVARCVQEAAELEQRAAEVERQLNEVHEMFSSASPGFLAGEGGSSTQWEGGSSSPWEAGSSTHGEDAFAAAEARRKAASARLEKARTALVAALRIVVAEQVKVIENKDKVIENKDKVIEALKRENEAILEAERSARESGHAVLSIGDILATRPRVLNELIRCEIKSLKSTGTAKCVKMRPPPAAPPSSSLLGGVRRSPPREAKKTLDRSLVRVDVLDWKDEDLLAHLKSPTATKYFTLFSETKVSSGMARRFRGENHAPTAFARESSTSLLEFQRIWLPVQTGFDDPPRIDVSLEFTQGQFLYTSPSPFADHYLMDGCLELFRRAEVNFAHHSLGSKHLPPAEGLSDNDNEDLSDKEVRGEDSAAPRVFQGLYGTVIIESKLPHKFLHALVGGDARARVADYMSQPEYDAQHCPVRQLRHYMLMHLVRFGIVSSLNYYVLMRMRNDGAVLVSKVFDVTDASPFGPEEMTLWEVFARFVAATLDNPTFKRIPRPAARFFLRSFQETPGVRVADPEALDDDSEDEEEGARELKPDVSDSRSTYDPGDHGLRDEDVPGGGESEERPAPASSAASTSPASGASRAGGSTRAEEDEAYAPREDLRSEAALRAWSDRSATEVCAAFGGNAAWTALRLSRTGEEGGDVAERAGSPGRRDELPVAFHWVDLFAPARFDRRLPRELALSPFPLRGDSAVLAWGRTGPVRVQRFHGRDLVFKILHTQKKRAELDGARDVLPTRVLEELDNEARVYAALQSFPLRRGRLPAFVWRGALLEGWTEALVTELVKGRVVASRADARAVEQLLGELHAFGVLHGDVRAENFLIAESDGAPVALDFGFSKLRGADFGEDEAGSTAWRRAVDAERERIADLIESFVDEEEEEPSLGRREHVIKAELQDLSSIPIESGQPCTTTTTNNSEELNRESSRRAAAAAAEDEDWLLASSEARDAAVER